METQRTRPAFFDAVTTAGARSTSAPISRDILLRWGPLTAVVALAAGIRFTNIASLGYINHYYAAAVQAMLQSWHNFFFVAAEPGGSVSVDKPPVGLWIQAISAHFLGVNTIGLLLPEILAGLVSVVVVYHLVKRRFGAVAGLIAALVLAVTPVTVATDRNNTIDSLLILILLLAAWAFIVATEQGSLRYLLAGAVLVGVAFNVKMLEAYLPLPAFYALYFLGSSERLPRKIGNLVLASVVLVVVSLSWATIVDLVPADQRPYVGSSGDNSELSLAIGYNGVERLVGMGGRGSIGSVLGRLFGGSQSGRSRGGVAPQGRSGGLQPRTDGSRGLPQTGPGGGFFQNPGGAFPPFPGGGTPPQRQPGPVGFGGGGVDGTGMPGPTRLLSLPLSKDIGWLLPFGLFGAVLLAVRSRPRWPVAPKHQALLVWGGWLLTGAVFFSVAGFFHEYYLSTIAPPLAALVGIGAIELWQLRHRNAWFASLLVVIAAATLRLQLTTAEGVIPNVWWLPGTIVLLAVGAGLLMVSRWIPKGAIAGFAAILAALLITPAIWLGLTAMHPSENQSLPAAYDGRSNGPINRGGIQVNQALLQFLQAHTRDIEYLMAVPSSMQGADYVLATGRPVLYLGGFMGIDQVVTPGDLSALVEDGQLRYIYWNSAGRGGFRGGFGSGSASQPDISNWVQSNCTPVQGFDTDTRNSGAPDGTSGGSARGIPQFGGPGGMQVSLYQCSPAT